MSNLTRDVHYLRQYWGYLVRYKTLLIMGFVLIPLIAGFHLLQPYLIKRSIDEAILVGDMSMLLMMSVFFGLCVCGDFLSKTMQSYLFQYIGQKTVMEIRRDLFAHVLNLGSSYYDKTPVGVINSRLTSDIESLNDSFASGLVTLLADLLTLIGIIVVMFFLSPQLTLVTILIVPPLLIMVNFFRLKLRFYYDRIRSTIGTINGFVQEQFQGVAVVQMFHQEASRFEAFERLNNRYKRSTLSSVSYDACLYSLVESLQSILIALIIWYGWGQYSAQTVTLGVLVAFIDYAHKFFMPLKEISNKFAILQHALAALDKIFSTFELSETVRSGNEKLDSVSGTVQFYGVSFAYPTLTDKPVLKGVSFMVKPGEVLAIVGPTGSGKTSILRLLSRLYDGYEGQIFLDGKDILNLDHHDVRRHISVVTQESDLFSESVRFNITLNHPDITDEVMINAAKQVGIHDLILSLKDGYDTVLGKGEQSVSVGESQLISFARALASPAPIIVLDEATASVDSLTEKKLQEGLRVLLKKKTSLVVAHRLSTIRHATRILALKDGEIIECGTHEALMKKNSFYANLYHCQFASFK